MKKTYSSAFTLIEMIIAITVFTLFIGFAMGGYLTFHRAQQEAAISRTMLLESERVMSQLTTALKENALAYEFYEGAAASPLVSSFSVFGVPQHAIDTNTLVLSDVLAGQELEYHFDSENQALTLQIFELGAFGNREPAPGYGQPLVLHSEAVTFSNVSFRIVPGKDPYSPENILEGDDSLWFQPNVQIKLTALSPGRVRDEIVINLQTSVTSRIYQ